MRVSLKEMLPDIGGKDRVICGFNVFGYEDALAVIEAAEEQNAPVILMVNRAMAEFLPPVSCGPMLAGLADRSSARIAIHLDHSFDLTVLKSALESGFTSVMFDGSHRSLDENIQMTLEARSLADSHGASLEGEVGTVPYSDLGETDISMTEVAEAERFARETGVDVLAVSVGNIHRLTEPTARIDFNRLSEIQNAAAVPLVIHGVSGLPETDIKRLLSTNVAKFNIGTRLRMAFGKRLRETLKEDIGEFDRLKIMKSVIPAMRESAIDSLIVAGW